MRAGWVKALLVGDGGAGTRRGLSGAAAVFVAGLALWAVVWQLSARDVVLPLDLAWLLGAIAVASAGPAALYAYRYDGLLVCLALGSALPVALYLVPTASPTMAPDESVIWGVQSGLLFGVPAGALGFILGRGARAIAETGRPPS